MGCSDIGGTSLEGSTSLCIMPEGHLYEGLVTDTSGRVADITAVSGDTVTFSTPRSSTTLTGVDADSIRITRDMAGASLVDCESRADSMGVSYTPLPSSYEGEALAWSSEDYRALTSALPRSGMAFLCSNRENPNTVVLRSDSFHREDLYTAVELLSSGECGTMDDAHCGAALRSVRVALGMPAAETSESHVGDLMGVGLVFTVVAVVGHFIIKWLERNNRNGGGGGGGSGGIPMSMEDIARIVTAAAEAGARAARPTAPEAPAEPTAPETASESNSSFWGAATAVFAAGAAWVGRSAIAETAASIGTSLTQGASSLAAGIETFLTAPVLPMPILIIMPDCESVDDPSMMSFCSGSGPTA